MPHHLIERSQTRALKFTPNINPYATGSVLVEFGNTKVHVTAMIEESLPPWMKDKKSGWITAEYAMLPTATHSRNQRERKGISGRSQEIQRLIGRSLRAAINLDLLGPRSLTIDCDVLVADGGTRTASISGGYVALALAMNQLMKKGLIQKNPLIDPVAAISVGINAQGKILADLNYEEDSSCQTDMNVVMTSRGEFVEIQGTAEGKPFNKDQMSALLECAQLALDKVFQAQNDILKLCLS